MEWSEIVVTESFFEDFLRHNKLCVILNIIKSKNIKNMRKYYKLTGLLYIITSLIFFFCIIYFNNIASDEGLLPFFSKPILVIYIIYIIYGTFLLFSQNLLLNQNIKNISNKKYSLILVSNFLILPLIAIITFFVGKNTSGFGAIAVLINGVIIAISYFSLSVIIYLFKNNNNQEKNFFTNSQDFFIKSIKIFPIILMISLFLLFNVISNAKSEKNAKDLSIIKDDYSDFINELEIDSSIQKLDNFLNKDSQIEMRNRTLTSSLPIYTEVSLELKKIFENCNKKEIKFYAPLTDFRLIYLDNKLVFKSYPDLEKPSELSKEIFKKYNSDGYLFVCDKLITGGEFYNALEIKTNETLKQNSINLK